MNLKDAFRYQNQLKEHMAAALEILSNSENTMETCQTILCSRVMPEAQDVVTIAPRPSEYAEDIDSLVAFVQWLFGVHAQLTAAIRATKQALPIDLDDAVSLNTQRRGILRVFSDMASLHDSDETLPNAGTAYRFNTDGEQVAYRCDLRRTAARRFSQDSLRRCIKAWNSQVDDISGQIDRAMINAVVDFQPPFHVSDTFGDVYTAFRAGQLGA